MSRYHCAPGRACVRVREQRKRADQLQPLSRGESKSPHISPSQLSNTHNPSRSNIFNLSTSPPASITALTAAWLSFLLFSAASFSRRALVLELPLGATPVRIFLLSSGVKLTNPTLRLEPAEEEEGARPLLPCEDCEDLRRDWVVEERSAWPEGRRRWKRGCGVGLGERERGRVPMGTRSAVWWGWVAWVGGVGYMGCCWCC